MDPLVSYEQFVLCFPQATNQLQAERALKTASGLVRAVAKQTFTFVAQEAVILRGNTRILVLPQRPAVVDDDNPLTVVELGDFGAINFAAVEGRDFVRTGNELERGCPWWYTSRYQGWPHRDQPGLWAPRVQVTYSHGYRDDIPDELAGLVMDVAKALYDNPRGLRSFSTPEYSETYAKETLGATTVEGVKAQLAVMGYRQGAFSIG